jgi:hypothetical protein
MSKHHVTHKLIPTLNPHPHPPPAVTWPVIETKLRQNLRNNKEVREIRLEDKKLSTMPDKISPYTASVYAKLHVMLPQGIL